VQVAKRRDPAVLTVDRYGAGDAAKGGADSPPAAPTTQNQTVLANGETVPVRGLSPPAPRQEAPRLPTQNAVPVNGENKSTVAAPLPGTAKVVLPGSVPILPARNKAPILPADKTPPSSGSNLASAPPRPSTVNDVASAEKMIADIVEKASKPKTLSPPAPAVQELWDFKKYIGFEEPAEANNDGGAAADATGSFENHQNHDSGPLAGENVMNVILVSAECSPWCKTGICVITLQPLHFVHASFLELFTHKKIHCVA
jgi:starch synthase